MTGVAGKRGLRSHVPDNPESATAVTSAPSRVFEKSESGGEISKEKSPLCFCDHVITQCVTESIGIEFQQKQTFWEYMSKTRGRILNLAMRRLTSILAILLLLITAAPVLACVTGAAMSHEESACCRAMHGQCGEMAKQGCCRTEVRTDNTPQIAATSPAVSVHWICVAHLPSLPSPARLAVPTVWHVPDEHSPPGLLTAKTTVLRI